MAKREVKRALEDKPAEKGFRVQGAEKQALFPQKAQKPVRQKGRVKRALPKR